MLPVFFDAELAAEAAIAVGKADEGHEVAGGDVDGGGDGPGEDGQEDGSSGTPGSRRHLADVAVAGIHLITSLRLHQGSSQE